MQYEDVNEALLVEFPEFIIEDEYYLELPYIVAGYFCDFMRDAYNNGKLDVYKKGLSFIERLHLSDSHKVRELATIGYLEDFLDWTDKDVLIADMGEESKKWWFELNLFWSGKIKYIGESFGGEHMFENLYCDLIEKYGDEFNWREIMKTDNSLLDELNTKLSESHPLYRKIRKAVAKCDSNDDVLFLLDNDNWVIVHLTYSKSNTDGFPKFKDFSDLPSAMSYIEEQFVSEFLCE